MFMEFKKVNCNAVYHCLSCPLFHIQFSHDIREADPFKQNGATKQDFKHACKCWSLPFCFDRLTSLSFSTGK